VFTIDRVTELPPEWSLILGDALVNFRGALDHLAWELVRRGKTPNPTQPKNVAFPICDGGRQAFLSACGKELPGVARHYCTPIHKVQPYIVRPKAPKQAPLAVLRDLCNLDKHQQIHTILSQTIGPINLRVTHLENFAPMSVPNWVSLQGGPAPSFAPLIPDTELLRLPGTRLPPGKPDMRVEFDFTTSVAFDDGRWIQQQLLQISNTVLGVLHDVTNDFFPPATNQTIHQEIASLMTAPLLGSVFAGSEGPMSWSSTVTA
jgi:hypothetical protein